MLVFGCKGLFSPYPPIFECECLFNIYTVNVYPEAILFVHDFAVIV